MPPQEIAGFHRPSNGVGEDEVVVLPRLSQAHALFELPCPMAAQCFHSGRRQDQLAATARRLRLRDRESFTRALDRHANLNRRILQVDSTPPQPKELTLAHAGA